uniref:Glycosyltransferase n=1 Tax=Thermorudis peleae TaxID=1382356 RepID=A0A831TDW4_9BACT
MRLTILIWHIHGSYLRLLAELPHTFIVPVRPGRPEGYGGRWGHFDWPPNVVEVPAERVRDLPLDLLIFQTPRNYLRDQYEILTPAQRSRPRLYLEHNTPKGHPDRLRHLVDDPYTLVVHVTHYNRLFWDCGRSPTCVIEHTALVPETLRADYALARGLVVVNNLAQRGRVCGYDIFQTLRQRVPLDLAGMGSDDLGGLGDLPQAVLWARASRYRFFFNPIRYTSLPLAVVEAMHLGLPIVALATTELPTVIRHGENGFISNDLAVLTEAMRALLADPDLARRLGENARATARARFGLERFRRDWQRALEWALDLAPPRES